MFYGLVLACVSLSGLRAHHEPQMGRFPDHHENLDILLGNHFCTPAKDIFFLKTHKTASSSVLNILMRKAEAHDLTIVLPKKRSNLFYYPLTLNSRMMFDYTQIGRTPEIFALHTRLDVREAKAIMSPNSKFITILRHPIFAFESGYSYFNLKAKTGLEFEEFMNDANAVRKMQRREYISWFGFNQMFFDLGFNETSEPAEVQAQRAINMLEKNFHLVMIADFMDESLVLLKHELCWPLEDFVVFRHNARNGREIYPIENSKVAARCEELNAIDQKIFEYFVKKLVQRVKETGQSLIFNEVKNLRVKTRLWHNSCLLEYNTAGRILTPVAHHTTDKRCEKLARRESEYVKLFRQKYDMEMIEAGYTPQMVFKDVRHSR